SRPGAAHEAPPRAAAGVLSLAVRGGGVGDLVAADLHATGGASAGADAAGMRGRDRRPPLPAGPAPTETCSNGNETRSTRGEDGATAGGHQTGRVARRRPAACPRR